MRYREIIEKVEVIPVKPLYAGMKMVNYSINPTRQNIIALSRGVSLPQLRGLVLQNGCVVWPADKALHYAMSIALGREGEFDGTGMAGEDHFQVAVENNEIIYVGNPELIVRHFPNFLRVFDKIDIMGPDDEDEGFRNPYEPSEWGLPTREGGWSAYLG